MEPWKVVFECTVTRGGWQRAWEAQGQEGAPVVHQAQEPWQEEGQEAQQGQVQA